MSKHISAHLANKYLLSIYYVSSTEMPVAKKAHRILSKGSFPVQPQVSAVDFITALVTPSFLLLERSINI